MIHVVVGTSHLSEILGYGRQSFSHTFERFDPLHAEFRQRLTPLLGQPILSCSRDDLAKETVFDALSKFHEIASLYLLNPRPAELLVRLQRELESFARRDYHYPEFQTTLKEACDYLAISGRSRHGTIRQDGRDVPVFLPDFSLASRCFGFFGEPASECRWANHREEARETLSLLNNLADRADSEAEQTLRQSLGHLGETLPKRDEFVPLLSTIDSALVGEMSVAIRQPKGLAALLERAIDWMEGQTREEVDDTIPHLMKNRFLPTWKELEFHLSDTLQLVHDKVQSICEPFRERMETFRQQLGQPALTPRMRYFLQRVLSNPETWWGRLNEDNEAEYRTAEAQVEQRNLTSEARELIEQWWRAQKDRSPERGTDETIVIDPLVNGFIAHRSLHRARRKYHDVPVIGHHRLLAAQATRQGLGKPIISGLFPIDLWRALDEPVQHFLLNAAQMVGAQICRPINPNLPSQKEMGALASTAGLAEGDWKYGLDPDDQASTLNPDDFDTTLRKLGLRSAVRKLARPRNIQSRLARARRAFDWADAIGEYDSAIYSYSIEQSLHLQDVFDLYPLHKRVLGLVEHIIVPRLKDMGLTGSASSIWAAAFLRNSTHRRLRGASLPPRADWWSTLEAIGNWLLIANPLSGDILRLDTLLDDILSRMVDKNHGVNGVEGSSVTLDPPTPSVHANQLAELADPSNQKAACLTFYLGKLAIQLRNAIEHGIDHVVSEGLRVDCGGAWTEIPSLRLQNLKNEAADKKTKPPSQWRLEKELGNLKYVPDSAKALMLTPTSLKRCLVLLSLVLHAGLRQLQLP